MPARGAAIASGGSFSPRLASGWCSFRVDPHNLCGGRCFRCNHPFARRIPERAKSSPAVHSAGTRTPPQNPRRAAFFNRITEIISTQASNCRGGAVIVCGWHGLDDMTGNGPSLSYNFLLGSDRAQCNRGSFTKMNYGGNIDPGEVNDALAEHFRGS